ncbi:MAG TPA: hypothetical protein VGH33_23335 [Isosphaeraceae bacterium]|jgi:hypothetical protein
MAEIAGDAVKAKKSVYMFVNKRLEGFAPAAIKRVVELVLPGF